MKNKPLIIVLIIVILALLGLVLWFALGRASPQSGIAGGGLISFDQAAQSGHLPGKSAEEIQAELNQIVEEGMFNISIGSQIVFPNGKSEGAANIENIEANRYYMQLTIVLDDTGAALYESGAIKPGQFIENITLLQNLSAGTYSATATFTAIDQDSLDQVGTAAAKITIVVES